MRMLSLMAVTMISLRITIQILQAVQVAPIIQMAAICGQGNRLLWVAREEEEVVAIIMITMKKMKMMKVGETKWKK